MDKYQKSALKGCPISVPRGPEVSIAGMEGGQLGAIGKIDIAISFLTDSHVSTRPLVRPLQSYAFPAPTAAFCV